MVAFANGTHLPSSKQGDDQGTRSRTEIQSWIDHCSLAQSSLTLEECATLRDNMVDETVAYADGTKRTTRTGCAAVHAAMLAFPAGPA